MTIWKFPIQITDVQTLTVPAYWVPKHVGLDPQGTPCIWAMTNQESKFNVERKVYVHGTGHTFHPKANHYVGSFVDGPFVWHVFVE